MHLQHQVGGAGVAVGIGQGVGEGFAAIATAVQAFEIGIGGVEGVGIGTVGVEHQGAVSTSERAWGDWAGGHMVCTLGVVGQHTAGQGQVGFRSRTGVAVVHGFRQVVDDVHIQVAVGRGAIVIGDDDRKLLADAVGAVGVWMGFVIQQGVAVADHPSRSVETGDGQGVAQRGSNRLRETSRYTAGDDVDATHAQRLHTVQRGDGKGAALSQRRCIRAAAVAEIFLLQ
ncbi:hypothetical protein D3C78_1329370 [compost metagenome]